ncbi:hypothetical protein SHD_1401 [Shewanella decolorationis S12]|uniref:Uncharacterized protein n=1 Tax=Shewanella decolorationis S12 TaxID=1353536 RepID=A0ABN0PP56_9GAMM|nr:hypothetical protein SHD_1401 [Shewanella decolorationis S12]
MLPLLVGREASPSVGAPLHVRHRPERPLLYQLSAVALLRLLSSR